MQEPVILTEPDRAGSNLPDYTVSEISRQLKQTVEDRFGHIRVRGEIGECKFHGSGHVYLTLRDKDSVLNAVIWKGVFGKIGFKPESGMEVVCTGRMTIFAGQSKYQLVIEQMALAGAGALLKFIEDLRQKLAAEGLFAQDRKKPLPFLPRRIGIITSPTGAVIRDILHRLADRCPVAAVLWPVAVQGPAAAAQIVAAIAGFNALAADHPLRPDLLIVARGGGSLEDLMAFNDERVVRAAATSLIPLISAVGHETDTTLIDFAADRRAPTPTAAAEMAVPVRAELLVQAAALTLRAQQALGRSLGSRRDRLLLLTRTVLEPQRLLEPLWQKLDDRGERFDGAIRQILPIRRTQLQLLASRLPQVRERLRASIQSFRGLQTRYQTSHRQFSVGLQERVKRLPQLTARLHYGCAQQLRLAQTQLDHQTQLLASLSPLGVLQRGYVLVRDPKGAILTDAAQTSANQNVTLVFHDGERSATLTETPKPLQGRLF
jgi:exodeoxyribonuclease VII large subunit